MQKVKFGSIDALFGRRKIKNLRITVSPPEGDVKVFAPINMSETAIRTAVTSRIPWINKSIKKIIEQPRQSKRKMVSGESHYLWGNKYRLHVIEHTGKHYVETSGFNINLYVRPNTKTENKLLVLNNFYRDQLLSNSLPMFDYWQDILGVKYSDIHIRNMKTMWGSCNISTGKITLNLQLAKASHRHLEYVVLHELLHLIERYHNKHFKSLLDKHMPDWRLRQSELNKTTIFLLS